MADIIAGSNVFGKKPGTLPTPDVLANLREAVPGLDQLLTTLSNNVQSGLSGQLPADVARLIQDSSNARAVAGGYGGTPLAGNLTLRDLGLTSLQRQDAAANQAFNLFNTGKNVGTLDPNLQRMINEYNLEVAAAPDPTAQGQYYLQQREKDRQKQDFVPLSQKTAGVSGGGMPSFTPMRSNVVSPFFPSYPAPQINPPRVNNFNSFTSPDISYEQTPIQSPVSPFGQVFGGGQNMYQGGYENYINQPAPLGDYQNFGSDYNFFPENLYGDSTNTFGTLTEAVPDWQSYV